METERFGLNQMDRLHLVVRGLDLGSLGESAAVRMARRLSAAGVDRVEVVRANGEVVDPNPKETT